MLIKVRKDGNMMRIFPLTRSVRRLLEHELTYDYKRFLATEAERRQKKNRAVEVTEIPCYIVRKYANVLQLLTNTGYLPRIARKLRRAGHELDIKSLRPLGTTPQAYVPHWPNLKGVVFKPSQREMLERILMVERGQVCYPTGAGKSWMIGNIVLALPKARIVVSTRFREPLMDLYHRLRKLSPRVGAYCGGHRHNLDGRVMCVSTGCLHKFVDWRPDLVICDESQELATARALDTLALFRHSRMLCLSANDRDRFDGADFELEGLFGPVVANITYEQAVDWKLIVPIEVHTRAVNLRYNPGEGYTGPEFNRRAVWANRGRNQLIAHDARRFPNDQVLITVKTLEHALRLKQLLPEFDICYAQMTPVQLRKFQRQGLVPMSYRPITEAERFTLKQGFENGTIKRVIATTVWNRGVNFHRLQVLIRADAGASKIDSTQIPGRLSRTCQAVNKTCGILIDYTDRFDETLSKRYDSRAAEYRNKKWTILKPGESPLFRSPSES